MSVKTPVTAGRNPLSRGFCDICLLSVLTDLQHEEPQPQTTTRLMALGMNC